MDLRVYKNIMADAVQAFYATLRTSDAQFAASAYHSGNLLEVKSVQWMPGTTRLAVAYLSRLVIIWDAATGEKIEEFTFEGTGKIISFNAISGYLFVGLENNNLVIVDLSSKAKHTLSFEDIIAGFEVIPETTEAYVGIKNIAIYRIDYSSGTVISENLLGPKPIGTPYPVVGWGDKMWFFLDKDLVVHSVTQYIVGLDNVGMIFISRLSTGNLLFALDGGDYGFPTLTYLPSLNLFHTSGEEKHKYCSNLRSSETFEIVGTLPNECLDLQIMDGTELVCGKYRHGLDVQIIGDWQTVLTLEFPPPIDEEGIFNCSSNDFKNFTWSSELKCIAASTSGGRIRFLPVY